MGFGIDGDNGLDGWSIETSWLDDILFNSRKVSSFDSNWCTSFFNEWDYALRNILSHIYWRDEFSLYSSDGTYRYFNFALMNQILNDFDGSSNWSNVSDDSNSSGSILLNLDWELLINTVLDFNSYDWTDDISLSIGFNDHDSSSNDRDLLLNYWKNCNNLWVGWLDWNRWNRHWLDQGLFNLNDLHVSVSYFICWFNHWNWNLFDDSSRSSSYDGNLRCHWQINCLNCLNLFDHYLGVLDLYRFNYIIDLYSCFSDLFNTVRCYCSLSLRIGALYHCDWFDNTDFDVFNNFHLSGLSVDDWNNSFSFSLNFVNKSNFCIWSEVLNYSVDRCDSNEGRVSLNDDVNNKLKLSVDFNLGLEILFRNDNFMNNWRLRDGFNLDCNFL